MLTQLEKDVAKNLLLFAFAIAACRLTQGLFAWVLAAMGCIAALTGNIKRITVYFVCLPLLLFLSPVLVKGIFLGPAVRIGQIAMLFCMFLTPAIRRQNESIPIGLLIVYSVVALVSSLQGWMPMISYLKILNFVLFVLGVMLIGKMMQKTDDTLYQLRTVLLGLAFFIIVGSAVTYFFPSVGYSMEVQKAEMWGVYTTGAEVATREGKSLLNGVMNHSQTLATNVPLWFAWVICDMLIIERKFVRLHGLIIIIAPLLMYMSRSRTAFVVLCVSLFMICFYALPKANISARARARVMLIFYALVGLLVAALAFSQIRNQTISKWLRKESDIASDSRSLTEAVTASRMGLVEYNLRDFRLNPMLGKGFQVMDWHGLAYQEGRIGLLSAPIEKGVLPLMVLGETGVVGGLVFLFFLVNFYGVCVRRGYVILVSLFTALMAANMSEASFFSPGGGTAQWTSTIIGGFCLDMIVKRRNDALFYVVNN